MGENMKKLVYDVGASAIKYALMDNDGNIYEKDKVTTPQDCLESFIDVLKNIYKKYVADIDGIALSLPGTIDSKTGQIYAPGGLIYNENVNIVEQMHSFTSLNIAIENDGKSAALAEVWKGNLKNCQDGIVIVVGSGLGGGIIKDGKLWKGKHLFAGEFSYVLQDELKNFYESVWAVKGSTTALITKVAQKKQCDMSTLDGIKIFDMISQDDDIAKEALREVASSLARGIYNLQCILDPEKILIGGGISQQPLLLQMIKEELDKIYEKIPFDIPHAMIENCYYYNDANLIGALYNYLMMYSK